MEQEFKFLTDDEVSNLDEVQFIDYQFLMGKYFQKTKIERWNNLSYEEKLEEERQHTYDMVEYHSVLSPSLSTLLIEKLANLTIEQVITTYGSKVATVIKSIWSYQRENEQFVCFWETKSPFSQWHLCEFEATTFWLYPYGNPKRGEILSDSFPLLNQKYTSVEQFMMYHKAMLFFDIDCAKKIMATNDVRKIKVFGREVLFFNEKIWDYYKAEIVYQGNKAKFLQNENLLYALIATKGKTLVEAAPNDNIWGIGLVANDPLSKSRNSWTGTNLLGEILTLLRIELSGYY